MIQVKIKTDAQQAVADFRHRRKRLEHYGTVTDLARDASLIEEYVKDDLLHQAQTGHESEGMKEIVRLLAAQIESKANKLRRLY